MIQPIPHLPIEHRGETDTRLYPGFEGVTAFTTAICRPSSEGDELRFRGVDIREIVGTYSFDSVWRLLVEDDLGSGLLAEISQASVSEAMLSGMPPRVALQQMLLEFGERHGMKPAAEMDPQVIRNDLASLTVAFNIGLGMRLNIATQRTPTSHAVVDEGSSVAEKLVLAWKGDANPTEVSRIDRFLATMAEHGTTASTFAARVVASTGANAAACVAAGLSAIGGPKHGGATLDVISLLRSVTGEASSAQGIVEARLATRQRLPGLGHRVYRQQDPRVPMLKELASEIGSPLASAAVAYEAAAASVLAKRKADRRLPVNADLWLAVVLDGLGIPDEFMDTFLASSRIAGWSAHVFEHVSSRGKLMRPDDIYVGQDARTLLQR